MGNKWKKKYLRLRGEVVPSCFLAILTENQIRKTLNYFSNTIARFSTLLLLSMYSYIASPTVLFDRYISIGFAMDRFLKSWQLNAAANDLKMGRKLQNYPKFIHFEDLSTYQKAQKLEEIHSQSRSAHWQSAPHSLRFIKTRSEYN